MRRSNHRLTSPWLVVALCSLLVVAEGYDLIIYGSALPVLLKQHGWRLTSTDGGTIGSMVYVGMVIGSIAGGRLTDRFGRRGFVLGSIAWLTFWTAACALADAPWQLGLFRALTGIGAGALLPPAYALVTEYAPRGRTALSVTVFTAGVPVGGALASFLALGVLPSHGWRAMFWIGATMTTVVLALAVVFLPESRVFVRERAKRVNITVLFDRRLRVSSILFPLASFVSLLAWYGMNTWIAALMRDLHYPLTSALTFSLILNTGAIAGALVLAAVADRWGSRRVAVACALLAAVGMIGYVVGSSSLALLLALIAVFGMGASASLNLINAALAEAYPTRLRGTALGWSNGIGRLGAVAAPTFGGWILTNLGARAVFSTFLIIELCAAGVLTALVLTARASGSASTVAEPHTVPGRTEGAFDTETA